MITATGLRFHLGLHTSDIARAVRFYRVLLGVEPTKNLPDYARFELDTPSLVVALYPSPQQPGGALNHAGLRLPDSNSLVEVQRRLEEVGIVTQRQDGVECCYSRQTKFWVTDPDKVLWEIYTLHDDIDHSGFDDAPKPKEVAAVRVWEHRITDELPESLPHGNDSLDEIRLEGTFNALLSADRIARLLTEAHRALKPGGRIEVHGLVGDQPFPGPPNLPGMASLVRHVPVETEPLDALLNAGFGAAFYEKLGDIHCFRVNGVELREMRLTAIKPGIGVAGMVMYKGPFDEVTDERGTIYRRGESIRVSDVQIACLKSGPSADQFTFLSGG